MNYIAITFNCAPDFSEILIAELSEIGFDNFLENKDGFQASIEEASYQEDALNEIIERYLPLSSPLTYVVDEIEKKNWNEEWEKHYDPIFVEDKCIVRASFHQLEQRFPYEIIINPKMSFGTGHHETTYLMLKNQMDIDHKGKTVMDIGCGTGILSIMAHKLGAAKVQSCDIDDWSVENSLENFELNDCREIPCFLGTISSISHPGSQDIILANINRNVLLEEIPAYSSLLNPNGFLLLSGFYEGDIEDIEGVARNNKLNKVKQETKKDWATVLYQKLA